MTFDEILSKLYGCLVCDPRTVNLRVQMRWVRLPVSRVETARGLSYYRDALDKQREDQITWQPYSESILEALPEICLSHRNLGRSFTPLICFDIVEYQNPERVMRQFGFQQPIPVVCDTSEVLHRCDRRGKPHTNFAEMHEHYIGEWKKRESSIVEGVPITDPCQHSLETYMAWYRRITRLLITPFTPPSSSEYQPSSTDFYTLTHYLANIHEQCSKATSTAGELPADMALSFALHLLKEVASTCSRALCAVGQLHLIHSPSLSTSTSSQATSASTSLPHSSINHHVPTTSSRPQGRAHTFRGSRGRGRGRRGSRSQVQVTSFIPSTSSTLIISTILSTSYAPSTSPTLCTVFTPSASSAPITSPTSFASVTPSASSTPSTIVESSMEEISASSSLPANVSPPMIKLTYKRNKRPRCISGEDTTATSSLQPMETIAEIDESGLQMNSV